MATENRVLSDTAFAGADLSQKQYFLATFNANAELVLADGTDNKVVPIVEQAETGGAVTYGVYGGFKVKLGAAVTPGARLKSDANGKAIPALAADAAFGWTPTAGVADEIVMAYIQ